MQFSGSWEGGVLTLVHAGDYSLEESWRFWREALQDGDEPVALLLDLRGSEAVRTADELRNLALRLCQEIPRTGHMAIVTSDPLRFGLARMFGAYVSLCFEVAVFHEGEMERARDWLAAAAC